MGAQPCSAHRRPPTPPRRLAHSPVLPWSRHTPPTFNIPTYHLPPTTHHPRRDVATQGADRAEPEQRRGIAAGLDQGRQGARRQEVIVLRLQYCSEIAVAARLQKLKQRECATNQRSSPTDLFARGNDGTGPAPPRGGAHAARIGRTGTIAVPYYLPPRPPARPAACVSQLPTPNRKATTQRRRCLTDPLDYNTLTVITVLTDRPRPPGGEGRSQAPRRGVERACHSSSFW